MTRKIVSAACRIAAGSDEKLHLGDINIQRDWGWASEYVEAMWLMLQQDQADDFVIATGVANSLRSFVASAFDANGLDWNEHAVIDPRLMCPSEIAANREDPARAERLLGWKPRHFMPNAVRLMVEAERNNTAC